MMATVKALILPPGRTLRWRPGLTGWRSISTAAKNDHRDRRLHDSGQLRQPVRTDPQSDLQCLWFDRLRRAVLERQQLGDGNGRVCDWQQHGLAPVQLRSHHHKQDQSLDQQFADGFSRLVEVEAWAP